MHITEGAKVSIVTIYVPSPQVPSAMWPVWRSDVFHAVHQFRREVRCGRLG